jgi:4-amino-4-deoxy-L-arabinose transferase-like glycosyltransferase
MYWFIHFHFYSLMYQCIHIFIYWCASICNYSLCIYASIYLLLCSCVLFLFLVIYSLMGVFILFIYVFVFMYLYINSLIYVFFMYLYLFLCLFVCLCLWDWRWNSGFKMSHCTYYSSIYDAFVEMGTHQLFARVLLAEKSPVLFPDCFWVVHSVLLVCMSVFMPVTSCFDYDSFVVCFDI